MEYELTSKKRINERINIQANKTHTASSNAAMGNIPCVAVFTNCFLPFPAGALLLLLLLLPGAGSDVTNG
jgi:hypothetical protein